LPPFDDWPALKVKENLRSHAHNNFSRIQTCSLLLQRYRQSTVHQQLRACHILAQVTGKKDCRPSQIIRIANTTQRRAILEVFQLLCIRQVFRRQLCPGRAGEQGITPDPILAQSARFTLHHAQHRRFGGCVMHLLRSSKMRTNR